MELVAGLLILGILGLSLGLGFLLLYFIWRDRTEASSVSWADGERLARKDQDSYEQRNDRDW